MKGSVMGVYINRRICFGLLFLFFFTWFAITDAVSCDSCGRECTNACGTKHFRTCCFNYLRKRSAPNSEPPNEISADNEYSGFIIPRKILNEVLRTEQDLNSFFRLTSDGDQMKSNRKRQLSDSNVDYS